jgi:hypothetical protein
VQIVRWGSGRVEYDDSNPLVENKDPALPGTGLLPWRNELRLLNVGELARLDNQSQHLAALAVSFS